VPDIGFEVCLSDLDTLANTNIPFIEQTCSMTDSGLKQNASNDTAMFEDDTGSGLYLDLETTFVETRADLERLIEDLSANLEECARALREIRRRYAAADQRDVKGPVR
jgi:hypothetical protein